MTVEQRPSVSQRHVFYIHGYDPIPPRRYRELYRREAAAQAGVSGYEIAVKGGGDGARYGWDVRATMDRQDTRARIEVLEWADIVHASMDGGILRTFGQLARTAWVYLSTGVLFRLMRLRKGPVITALYPVGMLLGQLTVALAVGYGAAQLGALLHWAVGLFAALGAIIAVLRGFKRLDRRLFAYYLMQDYAYGAMTRGAYTPQMETRLSSFADSIAEALQSDVQEVLVVGHSSGAHLAVSVLADLIRAGRVPAQGPALGFLSLGQVVPMVSFLPRAERLRGDLAFLSDTDALTWVDVTAPGDGCSFALCDPVAVSGVAPNGQRWPLVISAAFTQSLSAEKWRGLRWRFFRLHFQYLCAFDRPRDYDYFALTAGPLTLAERYADRAPSPSRITRAVNRFRSVS